VRAFYSTRKKLQVGLIQGMMMKRGIVDKQGESMVAYQYGTRASFQYIRRIPALYILRPKKHLCGWNLVNALLSMNEAWMDECASRLQPLVDQ